VRGSTENPSKRCLRLGPGVGEFDSSQPSDRPFDSQGELGGEASGREEMDDRLKVLYP
jgi:hypothetical protein